MQLFKIAGLLILSVLSLFSSRAQTPLSSIMGQVHDEGQHAVSGATVALLAIKDSAVLRSTGAGTDGTFTLPNIETGRYLVRVTAVGFKPAFTSLALGQAKTVRLPSFTLLKEGATLKEVAVTAQKPYVEQKIDRTVVNPNAIVSNTGTNALEVLEKAPGVVVDPDGNITFKGKSGVLIMIDGKPTYLSGANLVAYLRSLPSSSLEQIELMDNPPARYDAAGNAGVINIRLKKNAVKGFNGGLNSSYTQGFYARTSHSLNLNYRINKINLFANTSYNYNRTFRTLDIKRTYYDGTGKLINSFDDLSYFRPANNNANIRAGLDYYRSAQTTWGLVFTGTLARTRDNSPVFSSWFSKSGAVDSIIKTNNQSNNRFSNKGLNLNYTHQYIRTKSTLTFDVDYFRYDFRTDQRFQNNTLDPNGDLLTAQTITDSLPAWINIFSAKSDFTMPLQNKGKLEAGLKSSYVNTDNAANYYNVLNGTGTVDYNLTNRFRYRENINAGYLNFNQSFKRFEVQTGLRLENTNGNGHQLGNVFKKDSAFTNHYTNLFPTAYLSYKLDSAGKNLLVLSYGRRIGRPNYASLNPFTTLVNKFTYFAGNPFLRPQFTDNLKLAYSFRSLFTVALTYNYTNNVFNETIHREGNVFISTTGNIGRRDNIDLSVNANLKPAPWWTLSLYAEVYNNSFEGQLYTGYLKQSQATFAFNGNSQMNLGKGWQAELGGFYNTKQAYGQFMIIPVGMLNVGIQKKVFQNRGTVRLNGRDIFRTGSNGGRITNIAQAGATFQNWIDTRVVAVGFTYNFGKSYKLPSKRKTGGADAEQSRVGN